MAVVKLEFSDVKEFERRILKYIREQARIEIDKLTAEFHKELQRQLFDATLESMMEVSAISDSQTLKLALKIEEI